MADFIQDGIFPTVIKPNISLKNFEDSLTFLDVNKNNLEMLLNKNGALLFRDFPIHSAKNFYDFIEKINLGKFVNYIGGDSPRTKVHANVYTSTEAPPNFHIPLHQELSFIKNFPKHIYFFCEIAPQVGGETIIGDARKIYHEMLPQIKSEFIKNELTYISHYYYKSKIMNFVNHIQRSHKSWIDVFETTNKGEVERKCIENEFEFEWLPRDWLRIKQTRPAIYQHPYTKDDVWFNQAHLYDFNPRLLGWQRYLGAKLFYINPKTRLHEIKFANGSSIPKKNFYEILNILKKNTVAYPWKKGDIMILDNILAMHGRAPFKGPRRILAAMTS